MAVVYPCVDLIRAVRWNKFLRGHEFGEKIEAGPALGGETGPGVS